MNMEGAFDESAAEGGLEEEGVGILGHDDVGPLEVDEYSGGVHSERDHIIIVDTAIRYLRNRLAPLELYNHIDGQ